MSKRTWITVIALVASLLIAATGTLAYLTDTDSDVNVMTLGNVDIEQIELQRTEDFIKNDGHTGLLEEGDLEPFVDGKPLYPAYPVNNQGSDYTAEPSELLYWGPYVTAESDGTKAGAGNGLWNDDKLVGAVDKMVFVQNTGSSPAYYRTLIAFECPEGVEYSEGSDKQLMMNINGNSRFQWEELDYVTLPDGQRYLVMCATYLNALESGEISRPSLLQVVMTHNATSETVAAMGKTYEILALSQAVQVENLEKQGAEKALDAAFGDCTEENLILWFSEMEGLPVVAVSTADELAAAFENLDANILLTDDIELEGEWTPIGDKEAEIYFTGTLDGAGHTISGLQISDGDYASLIAAMDGGTVKNLTVEGTVTAKNAAGIVARMESGKIENCVSNVNVTGTAKAGGIVCMSNRGGCEIVGCVNNGNVTGGNDGLGGIVGYANDGLTIRDCENNGAIGSASYRYAGGMVGYSTLTGTNPGVGSLITDCVNNGAVAASTGAGGIVGISTNNPNLSITACKNTSADITCTQAYGGILGIENIKTTVTDCVNDASGLNLIGRPK